MANGPTLPPRYGQPLVTRSHAAAQRQQEAFGQSKDQSAKQAYETPFSALADHGEICKRISDAVKAKLEGGTYRGDEPSPLAASGRERKSAKKTQVENAADRAAKHLGRQLTMYLCVHLKQVPGSAVRKHLRTSLKTIDVALEEIHKARMGGDIELRWLVEEICAQLQVPEPAPTEVVLTNPPKRERKAKIVREKQHRYAPFETETPEQKATWEIAQAVGRSLNLDPARIVSRTSWPDLNFARWVIAWYLSRYTDFNNSEIGRLVHLKPSNVKNGIEHISQGLKDRTRKIERAVKDTLEELGLGIVPL